MTAPSHAAYEAVCDDYDALRPGYPTGLLSRVAAEMGLRKDFAAVDIGAGTGRLAVCLRRVGARVVAVEPLAAMRSRIPVEQRLHAVSGTAENLPLRTGFADLVAAGQSWHWFQAGTASREARRVLRPAGALLLLWNFWRLDIPWLARLDELCRRDATGRPRHFDPRRVEASLDGGCWEAVRRLECRHEHAIPRERLADLVLTSSVFAAASAERRARVRADVNAIAAQYDLSEEMVDVPYRTYAFWTRSRDG